MGQEYRVSAVLEENEWEGQFGPMKSYKLIVDGAGEVEINQKPSTPPPYVEQIIFADLIPSDGKFPPRLKRAQRDEQPSNSTSLPVRNGHDKTTLSIARQSSIRSAAIYLAGQKDTDALWELTERFYADVLDPPSPPAAPIPVVEEKGGGSPPQQATSSSPVDPAPATSEKISAEREQGLRKRIAEVGIEAAEVKRWLADLGISKLVELTSESYPTFVGCLELVARDQAKEHDLPF